MIVLIFISCDPSVSTSSNNSSNQGEEFSQLSKPQLLKEQENDPDFNSLFQMATTDSEIDQVPYLLLPEKWYFDAKIQTA